MNKWLTLLTVYRLGLSSETRLRLILSPKVVPIVFRKEVAIMMVADPPGLTMGQEETIGSIDRTSLHTLMGVIAIMVALIVPFRPVVLAVHIKIVSVALRLMIETLIQIPERTIIIATKKESLSLIIPTTVDPVNTTTQSVLMITVVLAISHHLRPVQSSQQTMTGAVTSIVAMNPGQPQPRRMSNR